MEDSPEIQQYDSLGSPAAEDEKENVEVKGKEIILLNKFFCMLFLAHLSTECSVNYCDHSPSVSVVRLSDIRPQFSC